MTAGGTDPGTAFEGLKEQNSIPDDCINAGMFGVTPQPSTSYPMPLAHQNRAGLSRNVKVMSSTSTNAILLPL